MYKLELPKSAKSGLLEKAQALIYRFLSVVVRIRAFPPSCRPVILRIFNKNNAEIHMIGSLSNWQRRGLGILSIGGGALGFGSSMTAVLQGQELAPTNIVPFALGMGFFLWGIWCGMQMLEGTQNALYRNLIFWFVQTPMLQTPFLGYTVFCGAQLQVFAKLLPFQVGFFGSGFGAQFGINLGQSGARFAIGMNLVALCISL